MDAEKYLMNPHTGSVDTEKNWATEGFTQANAELIEVVKDKDGSWTEDIDPPTQSGAATSST